MPVTNTKLRFQTQSRADGNVDAGRVMAAPVDSYQSVDDHILGPMPYQISLRPHHEPYRCPCFHCNHTYRFDVASSYFGPSEAHGTIVDPCCCCSNPKVTLNLPNEEIHGEFKGKCGCFEAGLVMKFEETGEFATEYMAGCCIRWFPGVPFPCKHRNGWYGSASEEENGGEVEWRYVLPKKLPPPPPKQPCCAGIPCCPPKCPPRKVHAASWVPASHTDLKHFVASRHAGILQSELRSPYPDSVNGTFNYRMTDKRAYCYPCGKLCSWRMADEETAEGDMDDVSNIDVRFRGSFDQTQADKSDARILIAIALHHALGIQRALRSGKPVMLEGMVSNLHHRESAVSDTLLALAHQSPSILQGGMV
jgi:hypothetical protein